MKINRKSKNRKIEIIKEAKSTILRKFTKKTIPHLLVALSFLAGLPYASAQQINQSAVVLGVQKAPTVNGPWNLLPTSAASLTPQGLILDGQTNQGFYRLQISAGNGATGGLAVPLGSVSPQALSEAQKSLAMNLGNNWSGAMLAPYAYQVYDPAVNQGTAPAYVEFKVIAGPAVTSNSVPNSPVLPTPDLGFILVSLTTQDVPVPEMANQGPTMVEQLGKLAGTVNFKPMRYGHGLLVGEDTAGNPVAVIGEIPFQPPPPITGVGFQSFQGVVVSNTVVSNTPPLTANPTGYNSYQAFKLDYMSNPTWLYLQARRAETGLFRWNLENGTNPPVVGVPVGRPTLILPTLNVTGFDVQDGTVAGGQLVAGAPGILITGLAVGGTTLHVQLPDSTTSYYILMVTNPATGPALPGAQPATCFGWGPWNYTWAGWCSQERRYSQTLNGSCWSGCGACAWALLYGWWDETGRCNLLETCPTPAPLYNDAGVVSAQNVIAGMVGTFCAWGSGATPPWSEGNGWQWAPGRGYGISESWWWGVPYLSGNPRGTAESAINSGRPAIVGTGFYSHYPLAWGYAWQQYFVFCASVYTSTYWFVDEGWGGDPCAGDWVNADDCWFGNTTTLY